jgi:hypothetical protein
MENRRPTLFYSWQSDHSKTRSYIESALKKALENIASTLKIEDAPRLDKDTQGEVGAVSITATIKNNIDITKIFVADVSLIDQGTTGRKMVNQNVMFELGYAFGKKTEKAVILIADKDLGDATDLPFDIAQNRIIFCSPKNDPKADKLIPTLEYAIRAHLDFIDEDRRAEALLDSKEQLVKAVEDGKPTTSKSERFFEGIFKRYLEAAPEPYESGALKVDYGEKIADAYQKSLPTTIELYDAINVAAEYGNADVATIAYRMLGELSVMYDQNGAYEASHEYHSLLIQEVASIIIGLLAKYNQWQIIGSLIPQDFIKPKGGNRKYSIETTYLLPDCLGAYYRQKTGSNYAIPTTPLIQERFIGNDKILQSYVSGVLVLMLALRWYYPFVSGLLLSESGGYVPEYISKLETKSFADQFRIALLIPSIQELRSRLDEKRQQPLADVLSYWHRDLSHIFQEAGLLPIEKVGSK